MSKLETLIKLQTCDTERLRAERELKELLEAAKILECRAKRKELKGKQDQVVELSDEVAEKLAKLQREEEQVIEKINTLQAKLDSTSDYRVTQQVTRDMEGQVKRQGGIADEQNALLERQIKIDNLADQLHGMLAQVDHEEEHLTADFKEKGGALKRRMTELAAERKGYLAELEQSVAARYERLVAEKGGIAVARLNGDCCTACNTTILTGQLDKLLHGPALSECPNCHRLLVVREEDDE